MYIYDSLGEYTVRLNITDFAGIKAHDFTRATIINMSKRPHLIIDGVSGSNNVKASLINKGTDNAIDVTWEITIKGFIFNIIDTVSKGNFTCIGCNCSEIINSDPIIVFGLVKIVIMADAQNAERVSERSLGLIFGNYIMIF